MLPSIPLLAFLRYCPLSPTGRKVELLDESLRRQLHSLCLCQVDCRSCCCLDRFHLLYFLQNPWRVPYCSPSRDHVVLPEVHHSSTPRLVIVKKRHGIVVELVDSILDVMANIIRIHIFQEGVVDMVMEEVCPAFDKVSLCLTWQSSVPGNSQLQLMVTARSLTHWTIS